LSAPRSKSGIGPDQRLLLIVCAVTLALIAGVSLLAPRSAANDPQPTTYNAGPDGAKAAYLLFQRLGVSTSRWDRPIAELSGANPSRTTLVLAEPLYAATDEKELAAEVKGFLQRGGRVLATGPLGARLLPDGEAIAPGMLHSGLCQTTPEGPGPLARAGSVEIAENTQWASDATQYRVEQRCGMDAVVVQYPVGRGEAIWWSSATPLTNAGLKQNSSLRLLLASIGTDRAVVFDESLHKQTASLWDAAQGLPLKWLAWQAAALFVLLVLSFSRRRGPVRSPVALPRSSPLEFAESMGDLYEKGGATSAATEAAKRRLLRVLAREAGVAQAAIALGPDAIAEALRERVGGDWSKLAGHLRTAEEARDTEVSPRSALALVQALSEDGEAVRRAVAPASSASAGGPIRVKHAIRSNAAEELQMAGTRE
jgi:hypothetical protein